MTERISEGITGKDSLAYIFEAISGAFSGGISNIISYFKKIFLYKIFGGIP